MSQSDAIKVCCRFRPMNKVESQQATNGICIKLSGCRRAVRVNNIEFPKHPHMFNFDQIYPPGTTQEAVYQYTGRPLVENTMKGFNSTLFAYGQTGSGKTHSMMGIPHEAVGHSDLEGIIPRVIKDIFKEILALDSDDEYTISMSMCEIYLEKVRDLLRVREDYLPIRIDPQTNEVNIVGIEKVYCQSAEECLDMIAQGNMSRATSMTKMNPTSSRSHCVIILNVLCKKASGGIRVSKVKMIDLAGSETVKKTGATAQRLEEAKSINRSLSTLNSVLTALGKPGSHVPFRNSALTKILRDSLGGNAKTSLLLAASPCTYNCLETVSTMRFGVRAKKVRSRAIINEELTVAEYKRRNKKYELENEKLKKLLQLRDAQMRNCSEYVKDKPIADTDCWDRLTEESQFNILMQSEQSLDMKGIQFEEVDARSVMYDHKTGKVISGKDFTVDINKTPDDERQEDEMAHRAMLHRQLTLSSPALEEKPASRQKLDRLLEQVEDLKGQLVAETGVVAHLMELLDAKDKEIQDRDRNMANFDMMAREGAIYKQKCEFLQNRADCEMGRLQADLEYYQILADEFDNDGLMDIPSTDSTNADPAIVQKMRRQEQLIKRLRVEAGRGNALQDSLVNSILMADLPGEKKAAIQAMISKFAELKTELKLLNQKTKSQERRQASASLKEKHTDRLKANWETQLASMEKALVATVNRYKEEKKESILRLEEKEAEIARLNAYVKRMGEAREARGSTQFGRKRQVGRQASVSKVGAAAGAIKALKSVGRKRRRLRKKSKSPEPSKRSAL